MNETTHTPDYARLTAHEWGKLFWALDPGLQKTDEVRAHIDRIIADRCNQAQAALLREIESEMLSRIGARMVSNDYMDLMFALRARAEAFKQRLRDGGDR